jgi:hypothetical protein
MSRGRAAAHIAGRLIAAPWHALGRVCRVWTEMNSRPCETVTLIISCGSAAMFLITPQIMERSESFWHLEKVFADQHPWGWLFFVVSLAHIISSRSAVEVRRLALTLHWMLGGFVCWVLTFSPPLIAPSDILYFLYLFVGLSAYFQAKFGRLAPRPPG